MFTINKKSWLAMSLAAVLSLSLMACSDSAEEQYQEALAELEQAREERQSAIDEVNEKRQEMEAARKELQEARDELNAARSEVLEAQKTAKKTATDTTIFRELQEIYVEDNRFEDSRIAVIVDGGMVTLRGRADSVETADEAVSVARGLVGVQDVTSQMVVSNGANKPAATTSTEDSATE